MRPILQTKLEKINSVLLDRNIAIFAGIITIILIIFALLLTRQLIFLGNDLQTLTFLLIVVFGYGLCSWVLLNYTRHTTKLLRSKSSFINTVHWGVVIVQSIMLGLLLYVVYYNTTFCQGYFSFCMGARIPAVSINAIASASATVLLGIFSYKFFLWYKKGNKKNFLLLSYGLATATLSISIGGDAFDKIIVQQVVVEQDTGSVEEEERISPESSFIYKTFEQYDSAKVQYKVVEPDGTSTLYIIPSSYGPLHKSIVVLTSDPKHILLWISTVMLLYLYYQRTTQRISNFPLRYWGLLSIPLVLFLVGSGLIFSLPNDSEFRQYERIIFRAGSIGSSILYGVAFFIVTRNIPSKKVKDYLTITAIGITMTGISFSVSALQQTYGVAGHSLLLLSSYLFVIGFYASGIFLSQDTKLRDYIKKSADKETFLLLNDGNTPLLGICKVLEKRVLNRIHEWERNLTDRTGVCTSLTELEVGQYLSYVIKEIKILQDYEQIFKKEKHMLEASNEYLACLNQSALKLVYDNDLYYSSYKSVIERYRKGEHGGIRWVTRVNKDTIKMIKPFLELGVQIRHVNNIPPIDFAVSDKEMIARIQGPDQRHQAEEKSSYVSERPDTTKNLLVTNESAYIDHFILIFDDLWNNGLDAQERIRYIEQGLEPEFLDVINDRDKAVRILLELARSVKKEALLLLPNDRSMIRIDRIHITDYLIDASRYGRAIIKIICPLTDANTEIVKKISENAPMTQILDGNVTTSGILIVDGSKFLRAELRDPNAENIIDAIGFTIYSNSRLSVESFRSTFELLWKERLINMELRRTAALQKEFIDVAAHELRNPIQPILGLSGVLQSSDTFFDGNENEKTKQQKEMIDVIAKNARRLDSLTEDLLDVTRVEGNRLKLNKRSFVLIETIRDVVSDFSTEIRNPNMNIIFSISNSMEFESNSIIVADENRVKQVISNLINNAIKFTEEGTIRVTTEIDKTYNEITVNVKDSGTGIDQRILPKLFNKFVTGSDNGTGLGLYICKGIIEAHGGRIWAKNNADGKGATFSFSLPLAHS